MCAVRVVPLPEELWRGEEVGYWLAAAAKMGDILPASTQPLYRLENQMYSMSLLSITAVTNKEAKSTSPLLLRKYPPVDFAAMTEMEKFMLRIIDKPHYYRVRIYCDVAMSQEEVGLCG